MQFFLKILSGMANSVDLDQTAPKEQSDLGLHCLHMPFCQTLLCTKFQDIYNNEYDMNVWISPPTMQGSLF